LKRSATDIHGRPTTSLPPGFHRQNDGHFSFQFIELLVQYASVDALAPFDLWHSFRHQAGAAK
jgi:hypothetical protein